MRNVFLEAVHFGKPVVGIPFFFDQYLNMYLAEQKGYGISVPIETLDANNIASAVKAVLSTPRYSILKEQNYSFHHDVICNVYCLISVTQSKQS